MDLEDHKYSSFEIGPMGAIGEYESLFIRVNRNCPWNKCLFCPVYKFSKFKRREPEEIKRDIGVVKVLVDKIEKTCFELDYRTQELGDGMVRSIVMNTIIQENPEVYKRGLNRAVQSLQHVAKWLSYGGKMVFLQDANPLLMKTPHLTEVIDHLKETFPKIERITSYARSKTCFRRSLDELEELHQTGLSRLLVGLESGCDEVLSFMGKGVTSEEHIAGGRKVVESGIYLAAFVMPGLGGKKWSEKHVIETAKVLNEIDLDMIKIRSLAVLKVSPLYKRWKSGTFEQSTDDEMIDEIGRLIENLNCSSYIISDQMTNVLMEIEGQLPGERERLLKIIEQYRDLPLIERLKYRLGRYEPYHQYIKEIGILDPNLDRLVEEATNSVGRESPNAEEKVDRAVLAMKELIIP